MMSYRRAALAIILASNLFLLSCVYIVLPPAIDTTDASESKGWSAVVTNVGQSAAGDLHIDLTIRNETGAWSTLMVEEGSTATLTSDGKSTACETVFVGTGGHRLAPGFQMRGYLTGKKSDPQTQLIYVECQGATAAPGATLSVDYVSFDGALDYYHQEDGMEEGTFNLELDQVVTDLTYPIFAPVEGLIQKPDVQIPAISDNVISLLDVQRTDAGFQFTWQNSNPTEFALKTHIGVPPVIGSDGIIYGIFEIMDLASVPITPAGGTAEWETEAAAPKDVKGFYILLSVESKQMRMYVNHAIDISDR